MARNLTGIGGAASSFGSDWQISSIRGLSLSSVANVFTGKTGANICYRYKDRALTTDPLWPWPMNQRIIDALKQSGRTSVDVTKTMEEIFGPIPSNCRGNVSTPSSRQGSMPDTPVNLNVEHGRLMTFLIL